MGETVAESGAATDVCQVIAFPPARRRAAIRRTARVIHAQPTPDRADRVRHRVAAALFAELDRVGVEEFAQDEAVGAFFHQVELELYNLEDEVAAALLGE